MKKRILLLWGGGHMAEALARISNNFEFADKVYFLSRDPGKQALARVPKVEVVSEFQELARQGGLEGAVVLATRPFSSWSEKDEHFSNIETLEALGAIEKLVMISSTGVYLGAHSDSQPPSQSASLLVDEASATRPDHPYVLAERDISSQLPTLILRCAGLYDAHKGPHRFYLRKGVLSGVASSHINLLHYDDAARALLEILKREFVGRPLSQKIYNVVDGNALTRKAICEHMHRWGGDWAHIEAPSGNEPSSAAPSGTSNKIVMTKIWDELDIQPDFKSFLDFAP